MIPPRRLEVRLIKTGRSNYIRTFELGAYSEEPVTIMIHETRQPRFDSLTPSQCDAPPLESTMPEATRLLVLDGNNVSLDLYVSQATDFITIMEQNGQLIHHNIPSLLYLSYQIMRRHQIPGEIPSDVLTRITI